MYTINFLKASRLDGAITRVLHLQIDVRASLSELQQSSYSEYLGYRVRPISGIQAIWMDISIGLGLYI
jgi:hypothetical protein